MIDPGAYSHSAKAAHVFDNVLFVILAGVASTLAVYAIVTRKFFSIGIMLVLSAVMVLQDYLIKKLNFRLYLDVILLMIGLCINWFDRNIRRKTDS